MNYSELITETVNPDTVDIDLCSTQELLEMIHREDCRVAPAVGKVLPEIAEVVDAAVKGIRAGGRLIYAGAGTSGRLGVLDASECPPTFGISPDTVIGIIAGGDRALRTAAEGAEDSREAGAADILRLQVNEHDVVVGVAASGSTPYVLGAIEAASRAGAFTAALCNTRPGSVIDAADIAIVPIVGPEAIMGSTRMKAGTADKMVLNMISTAVMVKLGKVYRNLMVDLSPTNKKLCDRTVRIIMQAADVSREDAEKALALADNQPKAAIVMLLCGCHKETAFSLLEEESTIRKAVENYEKARSAEKSEG